MTFVKNHLFAGLLVIFTVLGGMVAQAADINGPFRSNFLGTAAEGYDVVAYFTQSKAVEGSRSFSHKWNDARWHFSTAENRDTFIKQPEKYVPQYGGYCAYAVSQGYTASVDPQAWSIVDGKLYLNYSQSVKATWETDIEGYISSANGHWPTVRKSL